MNQGGPWARTASDGGVLGGFLKETPGRWGSLSSRCGEGRSRIYLTPCTYSVQRSSVNFTEKKTFWFRRVVSGSEDYTLKVWDLETGALICTFICDGIVPCAAVSPDGEKN